MASADYKLCGNCGAKAFYDANTCCDYPSELDIYDGEFSDWDEDGHIALCTECYKTHKVIIVSREEITLDLENAPQPI